MFKIEEMYVEKIIHQILNIATVLSNIEYNCKKCNLIDVACQERIKLIRDCEVQLINLRQLFLVATEESNSKEKEVR